MPAGACGTPRRRGLPRTCGRVCASMGLAVSSDPRSLTILSLEIVKVGLPLKGTDSHVVGFQGARIGADRDGHARDASGTAQWVHARPGGGGRESRPA